MAPGPLDGVRVLDFGRFVAGPFCACLLGDLGADVIRVERVGGGEDRYISPMAGPVDDPGGEPVEGGAMFLQANRNKRSLTLNPTKPEGREVLQRLIATADVVVANVPGQTLTTMGIDYAQLTAVKPDVILATIDAFGPGPYERRLGFNGVAEAMSGAVFLSGPPGQPTRGYVPWIDYGSASLLAFGVVAALLERGRTGRGQHVQGALLRTAMSFSNYLAIEQQVRSMNRVSTHNRGQAFGPVDIFETSDGWVVVQVLGAAMFERWAVLMGERDRWVTDPRFATDELRGRNGELLSARMRAWCGVRTTSEVIAELGAAGVPAGPVYSPAQMLDDEHVKGSGFFQPVDYPGLPSPAPMAGTPVTLEGTANGVRHRAPTVGEHTDAILTELGYSSTATQALRDQRAI